MKPGVTKRLESPDRLIFLDIETKFDKKELNPRKMPLVRYAKETEIITVVVIEMEKTGGKWKDYRRYTVIGNDNTRIPSKSLSFNSTWIVAHNAAFDLICLKWFRASPIDWMFNDKAQLSNFRYIDTMAMANYLWHSNKMVGRPASLGLDNLGRVLVGETKLAFPLMENVGPDDLLGDDIGEQYLEKLIDYNVQDVELLRKVFFWLVRRVPNVHMFTIDWALRQFVMPRTKLHIPRVKQHLLDSIRAREEHLQRVGADITTLRSDAKCAAFIESKGYKVPTKTTPKGNVKAALSKTDDFVFMNQNQPTELGDLIRARLSAKSSIEITRSESFLECRSGFYHYHVMPSGTFTHRLAGKDGGGGNPLNLSRKSKLRQAIIPPDDHHMVVFDFSGLELRIARWGAKDTTAMELIVDGKDIYSDFICGLLSLDYDEFIAQVKSGDKEADARRFVGKTCLAVNTPVLTDVGWVPIQLVTTDHKLWDGIEWVSHDGLLDAGNKTCTDYYGIVGTSDHNVFCDDGTIHELQSAKTYAKTITRSATPEGHSIRTARSGGRLAVHQRLLEGGLSLFTSRRLRPDSQVRETKSYARQIYPLQTLCESAATMGLSVFDQALCGGAATLRESQRQGVQKLWRTWNRVSVRLGGSCSSMVYKEVHSERNDFWRAGPAQQQRPLQQTKHKIRTEENEHEQSTMHRVFSLCRRAYTFSRRAARGASSMARSTLRTRLLRPIVLSRLSNAGRYKGPLPQRLVGQTQRVYDLANAGPRHRFTVRGRDGQGYLVSNSQLSLQYGVGAPTFMKATNASGKYHMMDAEAANIVQYFRKVRHPKVQLAWRMFEKFFLNPNRDAMMRVFESGGWSQHINFPGEPVQDGWKWPSGRVLRYPNLRRRGGETVFFPQYEINDKGFRSTYGAAAFQSFCQSCANEVIDYVRYKLIQEGFVVASECYDELTVLVPRVRNLQSYQHAASYEREETLYLHQKMAVIEDIASHAHLDWWLDEPPPLKVDIATGPNYLEAKP